MRNEEEETRERIRAAEAILNRGMGKVAELSEEKRQAFAFFEPVTPDQIKLAEKMLQALPENTDSDPNGNGAG